MTCTSCQKEQSGLEEREYRRVFGTLLVTTIVTERGTYCERCRGRLYRRNMTRTLIFGWWGIKAGFVHNPRAIAVNRRARVGSAHDFPLK